jgi:adenylate kinase family enzyme
MADEIDINAEEVNDIMEDSAEDFNHASEEIQENIKKQKEEIMEKWLDEQVAIAKEALLKASDTTEQGKAIPDSIKSEAFEELYNTIEDVNDGQADNSANANSDSDAEIKKRLDAMDEKVKTFYDFLSEFSGSLSEDRVNEIMDKFTSDVKNTINEKVSKLEETYKSLIDKLNKGQTDTTSEQQTIQQVGGDLENTLDQQTDVKKDVEAKEGEGAWERVKKLFKYWKLLVIAAGALGIYLFLRHLADELTGCYEWKGGDSNELNCQRFYKSSKNAIYCSCGLEQQAPETGQAASLSQCKGDFSNFPFCNKECGGPSQGRPFCTETQGQNDSIYYNYQHYNALTALWHVIKEGAAAASKGLGGLKKIIIKILIIVGIVIGGIILIIVGYKVIQALLKKKEENSGPTSKFGRKRRIKN